MPKEPLRFPETRRKILHAALAVLEEEGHEHVTIRRIAKRAGMQGASVYHYFAGKENLIAALMRETLEPSRGLSELRDDPALRSDRPRAVLLRIAELVREELNRPIAKKLICVLISQSHEGASSVAAAFERLCRVYRLYLSSFLQEKMESNDLPATEAEDPTTLATGFVRSVFASCLSLDLFFEGKGAEEVLEALSDDVLRKCGLV